MLLYRSRKKKMSGSPTPKKILPIVCISVLKENVAQEANDGSTQTKGHPANRVHLCSLERRRAGRQ